MVPQRIMSFLYLSRKLELVLIYASQLHTIHGVCGKELGLELDTNETNILLLRLYRGFIAHTYSSRVFSGFFEKNSSRKNP